MSLIIKCLQLSEGFLCCFFFDRFTVEPFYFFMSKVNNYLMCQVLRYDGTLLSQTKERHAFLKISYLLLTVILTGSFLVKFLQE